MIQTASPFRIFEADVVALRRLSPCFLRVTLAGPDLESFADNGFDQRIKLVFPLADHGYRHLPTGPDWYRQWRGLPDAHRNPLRTYTVRAVRRAPSEVDVDVVLHPSTTGDGGPAARWAATVRPGDRIAVVGPDTGYAGAHGGLEFRPPDRVGALLLAGDETAVPAICAILERLPHDARGVALLEVPSGADVLWVQAPPAMRVDWLPRGAAPHGARLVPAVRAAVAPLLPRSSGPDVAAVDGLLWEVPEPTGPVDLYAWLAGEAGVITTLRRHLVTERGMARHSVAFMGYWRHGHPEDS